MNVNSFPLSISHLSPPCFLPHDGRECVEGEVGGVGRGQPRPARHPRACGDSAGAGFDQTGEIGSGLSLEREGEMGESEMGESD